MSLVQYNIIITTKIPLHVHFLPIQFFPSLVAYPGGHRLCGEDGHSSHGLPQATPILPQHSDLVTKAWALFSHRPLLISNQHDPFLLSTIHYAINFKNFS